MSSNAVMNKANEAINKIDTNKKMFGGFMIVILVIIVGFFIYSQIKSYSNYVQTSPFFDKFGTQIRRINYKKMTVIYSIFAQTLYVRRILPASLILE